MKKCSHTTAHAEKVENDIDWASNRSIDARLRWEILAEITELFTRLSQHAFFSEFFFDFLIPSSSSNLWNAIFALESIIKENPHNGQYANGKCALKKSCNNVGMQTLSAVDDGEVVNVLNEIYRLNFHMHHNLNSFTSPVCMLNYFSSLFLPFMDLFVFTSYAAFRFDDSSSSICHFCVNKERAKKRIIVKQ